MTLITSLTDGSRFSEVIEVMLRIKYFYWHIFSCITYTWKSDITFVPIWLVGISFNNLFSLFVSNLTFSFLDSKAAVIPPSLQSFPYFLFESFFLCWFICCVDSVVFHSCSAFFCPSFRVLSRREFFYNLPVHIFQEF